MDFTLDKKLDGFRQIAQEKLQSILCSIPDSQKDLVIETCLIKPLEHICGASWLRFVFGFSISLHAVLIKLTQILMEPLNLCVFYSAKGVNKIYKFDSKNPPQRNSTIVYFISSSLITFKFVLDQIHAIIGHQQMDKQLSDMATKPFHCIVLPTVLHSFEVVLEEEGLFGFVELHRFNWDFITIDAGALSLEIPQLFHEVFIREDTSLLSSIAHSLRIFNMICRHPPILITYGENAAKVANQIDQIEGWRNGANATDSDTKSDFSAMVIMDRNKDYASALMTPVIYSGLLLELFRSVAGTLQIDEQKNRIQSEKLHFLQIKSKKDAKASSSEAIAHLRLSESVDGIYNENRYKHFADAISMLSAQSKALGMESRTIQGMEINEMNEFVTKKLPKVQQFKRELFKHLLLCEHIVNELGGNFEQLQTLEESMLYNRNKKQNFQKILEQLTTDAHRYNSLRSICLLYLTCGLTADEASTFITNYLNAFGYQHLPIFSHLTAAKLFPDLPNLAKTKILTNISLPKWQNAFQIEANRMKLLPTNTNSSAEQTNEASGSSTASGRRDPIDASFVFNGSYIPLITQLCNILCSATKIDELAEKFGHTEQIVFHRCFQQTKLTIKEMMAGIKKGEYREFFPLKPRTIVSTQPFVTLIKLRMIKRMIL